MKYTISVERTFSAAHALRGYQGRCEHLHGHNWKVKANLSGGKLNATGMLLDFTELKAIMGKILAHLDHQYLNEVPPFTKINPTAEHIASYILKELKQELRSLKVRGIGAAAVEVWESETSSARAED
jgi:6-pyruvoyltetrahydropterin/6-carboxytetrahydropterin synthase